VQNLKDTSEDLHVERRADMRISGCLTFMWYVVRNFRLSVSVAAPQKTRFEHSKNEKRDFHGTKQKTTSMVFFTVLRATRMSDMEFFLKYIFIFLEFFDFLNFRIFLSFSKFYIFKFLGIF
jgi:hypothetical protein